MSADEEHQIGYKVLPRGTPVVTAEGEQLGTVAQVLDNAREHIFDGIVVRTADGKRFVDAPEVASITNRQVTLTIDRVAAAELPAHRGFVGRLEHGAQRRANRLKRRLGRG
jgi:sporulation protein YlmC with PRC-barrel domain